MNISGLPVLASLRTQSAAQSALVIANTQPILDLNGSTNGLDSAGVDAVLVALDGNGLNNGVVDLSGQTPAAPPGASGLAAKLSLEGKGWTVTVDVGYHPQVLDWVSRVTGAGGADPASATKQALSDFMDALDAASLTSRMLALNCFVPDSLIAACVPLIANAGLSVWTNNNFSSGDLSVDGLQGSSSAPNKYLSTGLAPDVDWALTYPFVGLTVYQTASLSGPTDKPCWKATDTINEWRLLFAGSGSSTCLGDPGYFTSTFTGLLNSRGYVSVNSIFDSAIPDYAKVVYVGRSGLGHSLADEVPDSNGLGPFPGEPPMGLTDVPIFISNISGVYQDPSKSRLSFAAFHDGLLEADSAALYTAVQAMRTALGGGYV